MRLQTMLLFAAILALGTITLSPHLDALTGRLAARPATIGAGGAGASTARLSGVVRVPARGDGHFEVTARVGARRVPFMVDTGATVVALTWDTARDLGLASSSDSMDVPISTANGSVNAKLVTIPRLEIDSLDLSEVRAVVLPRGALDKNLLGMSFLSRLKRFAVDHQTLVMEQ
jgi:aspartyl protease family protein